MIFWPETAKSGTWGNSIVNKLPRNGSVVVHKNQSASIWYHLLSATLWCPFHPVPPPLFQRHVGYKWPATPPKWCPKFIALVSLSFLQIIMVHWTPSRVFEKKLDGQQTKPPELVQFESFQTSFWYHVLMRHWAPRTRVVVDPEMSPFRSFPLEAQKCAFRCWSWIPSDPLVTSNWATPARFCMEYGFAEAIR